MIGISINIWILPAVLSFFSSPLTSPRSGRSQPHPKKKKKTDKKKREKEKRNPKNLLFAAISRILNLF